VLRKKIGIKGNLRAQGTSSFFHFSPTCSFTAILIDHHQYIWCGCHDSSIIGRILPVSLWWFFSWYQYDLVICYHRYFYRYFFSNFFECSHSCTYRRLGVFCILISSCVFRRERDFYLLRINRGTTVAAWRSANKTNPPFCRFQWILFDSRVFPHRV
jgi:hypothetical protein